MNKQRWLAAAEVFDSWRVVPRLFLLACFIWTISVTTQLLTWYTHLPAAERGIEAAGFASAVFLGVIGFLKLVYGTYSAHGRDWNDQPITSQTVVATSTTKSGA